MNDNNTIKITWDFFGENYVKQVAALPNARIDAIIIMPHGVIVNELVFIGWQDMLVDEMPTLKGEDNDHD